MFYDCFKKLKSAIRSNDPLVMAKLKFVTLRVVAICSSLSEGVTSKLGVNDTIFWLYQVGAGSTHYKNSEVFFEDNPLLSHFSLIPFFCVLITDYCFVGRLFFDGDNFIDSNVQSRYGFWESPGRYLFVNGVVGMSCLSEGISSAPSWSSTAFEYLSSCNRTSDIPMCSSSEAFVSHTPLVLIAIIILCMTRTIVDYQTEGLKCIQSWLQKGEVVELSVEQRMESPLVDDSVDIDYGAHNKVAL